MHIRQTTRGHPCRQGGRARFARTIIDRDSDTRVGLQVERIMHILARAVELPHEAPFGVAQGRVAALRKKPAGHPCHKLRRIEQGKTAQTVWNRRSPQ